MVRKFNAAGARSDDGFTLIEVMIAMTILSVGLMSIAVAQLTAIKVSSRSKHLQDAMFLAREEMDTLSAIQPDPAFPRFFGTPDDRRSGHPARHRRRRRHSLRAAPRSLRTRRRRPAARVVVTVTWDNANAAGTSQIQLGSVMRIN
jgi:type IV pilus assembly protein PilV